MEKKYILFVNKVLPNYVAALVRYEKLTNQTLDIALIAEKSRLSPESLKIMKQKAKKEGKAIGFVAEVSSLKSFLQIQKALLPINDCLLSVVVEGESGVDVLRKILPNTPTIIGPTTESLEWATNKIAMRQRFEVYDRSITPKFAVIKEGTSAEIRAVERKVGFPMVVKPSGLTSSILVSICYHHEELEKTLKRTKVLLAKAYKSGRGRGVPRILVEQYMEGTMYSIDAYIDLRGNIRYCPLVKVETGRTVGFDDFFGYQRITPTTIKSTSAKNAEIVAGKAIRALALRSTTAHVELMRTESGWKVIELGPRRGGYRHIMYNLAFGIDHWTNDMLTKTDQRTRIYRKPKGHVAVLQFFAKKEGNLSKIVGMKKIEKLESCHRITAHKKPGDKCLFAKNGGNVVVDTVFFNKDRARLLADVRRLESELKIVVVPAASKAVSKAV